MQSRAFILALPLLAAIPAAAQERGIERTLLDRSLHHRPVLITALDSATITYSDAGLVRTEPTAEYLAILPTPKPPAPAAAVLPGNAPKPEHRTAPRFPAIELIDGQRLTGTLVGAAQPGDAFAWSHPLLGVIQLKVDDAQRIRFQPSPVAAPDPANDLVLLANGDRLAGFIESVADPLSITINQQQRKIPLERIAEIVFANPPQPPAGAFAWLGDGSVVAVRELRTTRVGELLLTPRLASDSESPEMHPGPGAASMAFDSLQAVNFDISALSPLAALAPTAHEPLGGRRWAQPARSIGEADAPLGAADILLPGPMAVRWSLPESAQRLSATAELPRQNWTWGDCEIVVEVATAGAPRELFRQRLTADTPSAQMNADLGAGPGRTLIVRLEPGPSGPIEDRAILRLPLLAATPAPD
jgi:hypothetical protein